MANVQLPSISITPGDIDSASLPELQKIVKGLLNTVAILTEELTHLLNHLDTRNMTEIDGDILVTGTVTAGKMKVDELSAISANLGHITAGLIEAVDIFGSYIATSRTYPRCEISNTDDMLGALKSPSNSVKVFSPSDKLSPVVQFEYSGMRSYIFYDPVNNTLSVTSNVANINLSTLGRIELFSGQGVFVQDWDFIKSNTTGRSLKDDFVMR